VTIVRRSDVALETPLSELLRPLTPNASFFIRNHALAVPRIPAPGYKVEVRGAHGPHVLDLERLRALPRVSEIVTLVCAGNGRTAFVPVAGGVPWGFGAIATARWDGVRLRDVLDLAGPHPHARHVAFEGFDEAPGPGEPPYRRSIPLERALRDGTIVADTMNGEPLPAEHGGPLRLVVAGWTANHSMKWLRRVTLADRADESRWTTEDYRVPGPAGTFDVLEAPAPVAILAAPENGAACARDVVLHGIAYGEPAPRRVRVEIDGAHAGDAVVRYDDGPYAWGRWTFPASLAPGPRRIAVRPAGPNGEPGPARATWNAKGYRYDGPHVVDVEAV
jgi:DMSO/TMAO reductase YedYZ molybdopterin-dependent catalytic subunit